MSVRWSVTHKLMTVLYTTDRYPAAHTAEREMVCLLELLGGWEDNVLCVCGRELKSDAEFRR